MNSFRDLMSPGGWLPEFAVQAGLTVAIVAFGTLVGLVLGRIVRVRHVPRVAEWLFGATSVLALILIPAVLLGGLPWWAMGVLGVVWVAPGIWAVTVRPLTPEQALMADLVGLGRTERRTVQRGGLQRRVAIALVPAWRSALTVTTVFGLLATADNAPRGTGLGGLIATGVREGSYAPALAGAVGLLILGLLGEIVAALIIRRTRRIRGRS